MADDEETDDAKTDENTKDAGSSGPGSEQQKADQANADVERSLSRAEDALNSFNRSLPDLSTGGREAPSLAGGLSFRGDFDTVTNEAREAGFDVPSYQDYNRAYHSANFFQEKVLLSTGRGNITEISPGTRAEPTSLGDDFLEDKFTDFLFTAPAVIGGAVGLMVTVTEEVARTMAFLDNGVFEPPRIDVVGDGIAYGTETGLIVGQYLKTLFSSGETETARDADNPSHYQLGPYQEQTRRQEMP